ncbi:hypothetical protein [Thaumasiovibrio sp. DFM-14]|uniref:hypothetical protein n=1 Tax=Thaumasiovibrio sp. DFM-14 TaxID=3384792 RepID=UPI0039A07C39
MKKTLLIAALFTSATAIAADNQVYRCEHNGVERLIEVRYPEGTTVPCDVNYTKADGSQVLWKAANTEGYCESKAAEFVKKQRGWGWNCQLDMPAPVQLPEITDEIEAVEVEAIEVEAVDELTE